MIRRGWAWVRCWWHALWHFHRMSSVKERLESPLGMPTPWRTTWIGCGSCNETHYGHRPRWLPW